MRMMTIASAVLALSVATVVAQTPGSNAQQPATHIAATQSSTPKTSAPTATHQTDHPMGAMALADKQFVKEAAIGGMAEVELGQLASDKGTQDRVKQFGQQMVTDHGKAGDELKSIAASKSIPWPTALDVKHKATKDRLSKLSGAAFDRAYVNEMVSDHRMDVAGFKKESQTAKDPDIKAFAAKTLPVVESHLQTIQDIQKGMMASGHPTGTSGKSPSAPASGTTTTPR